MMASHLPEGLDRRLEDYGLITGRSKYVDDLRLPEGRPAALYVAFVRSPYAHAKIERIRLDEAESLPGVIAAFDGAGVMSSMKTLNTIPVAGLKKPERRPLANGMVRYVGDPVAVVLAENLYVARDACDLVDVEYSPLPAVVDPEQALESTAPLLYDELGTNVAFHLSTQGGDVQGVFQQAEHIVRLRVVNQRVAASPLEPRVCLFDFEPQSGLLSAWVSSQAVYTLRDILAGFLGLKRDAVHVSNAQVGGGFGTKTGFLGEELIAAFLAVRYGRPIKWIEDRSENLQSQVHGRGQVNYIEAACSNEGHLLGLRVSSIGDLGAFLASSTAMVPAGTSYMLNGPYKLQAIDSQVVGVFTNKVPTAAYRGAGRPEATYILERTMDSIARELRLDPAEVRRRNFLAPEAFPYQTLTEIEYDSGNYQLALDTALERVDYAQWRERQRERREVGHPFQIGIGLSSFVEVTGGPARQGTPKEAATVRIQRDGTILVQSGVSHNGQGHFTAFAQIAASVLQLPGSQIEVRMNDSALPGYSIGTFGSRTTQNGASVVLLAAQAVREKAVNLAARVLEAAPEDMVVENGTITVRGVPSRRVAFGELARLCEEQPDLIEREPPNPVNGTPIEGLAAWRDFSASNAAFSSGTHVAIVEIDTDTGEVHLLTYVAVDDCGRVLNEYLAEAQVHGSLAQGIGQALYEEIVYDHDGQLLTSTLMDYALPTAEEFPMFVNVSIETPSPTNPLEAKGIGEAGCIAAPPAIVNAVLDALAPYGITTVDMPLKAEKLWNLLQAARSGELKSPTFLVPAVFHVNTSAKAKDAPDFA